MKNMIEKIKKFITKNFIKIIFGGIFLGFIIGYLIFITSHYIKIYNKNYVGVEATITNIEQYEYKESTKNNVGLKIEYSYIVNGKEYKHEYKGALTDNIYNVGDNKTIYYSFDNPEDIILDKTFEILILGIDIFILISTILYFVFIFRKKSTTLFIVFIVCIFADLFFVSSMTTILKTIINYEKTEAIVDRTYTYTEEERCGFGPEDSHSPTCLVQKTGALYRYEVNNIIYDASQLDVSSKTKYGDTKTIYYSPKNPMYYSFNTYKDLIILIFSLTIFTTLGIIANPFTKNKRKKLKKRKALKML